MYSAASADELSEKIDKYVDFARKLKELLEMKVTVIPFVIVILGKVPKGFEKRLYEIKIKGRIETIQTTSEFKTGWNTFRRLEQIYCYSYFS